MLGLVHSRFGKHRRFMGHEAVNRLRHVYSGAVYYAELRMSTVIVATWLCTTASSLCLWHGCSRVQANE